MNLYFRHTMTIRLDAAEQWRSQSDKGAFMVDQVKVGENGAILRGLGIKANGEMALHHREQACRLDDLPTWLLAEALRTTLTMTKVEPNA